MGGGGRFLRGLWFTGLDERVNVRELAAAHRTGVLAGYELAYAFQSEDVLAGGDAGVVERLEADGAVFLGVDGELKDLLEETLEFVRSVLGRGNLRDAGLDVGDAVPAAESGVVAHLAHAEEAFEEAAVGLGTLGAVGGRPGWTCVVRVVAVDGARWGRRLALLIFRQETLCFGSVRGCVSSAAGVRREGGGEGWRWDLLQDVIYRLLLRGELHLVNVLLQLRQA